MFDNRLEIFSPGKLPNIVTLQNMQYTRYSRNPRIAKVLLEFGWVKELNEGVKRIYLEMEQAFLNSPTYSEPNSNAVLLVLENNILNRVVRLTDQLQERLTEEVFTNLHEDERIVLQIAFMTGKVTVKDISIKIGRSKYYTSSLLKKLTEKGFLIWHGTSATDPTQYYTFAK
jgi:ATP-dependent DNA helicase RecG